MQNLRSFYVNGQLVTVPEDEMDEFMASMQERGETPDEVETYEDDGGNPLHVPVSERDEFMRTMGAQNRPIRNMKTVVMDDGKTLNLGEEDIRQFVQARRQGMPMSRGLLANTGVPDWYGKGREDREALADALGGIYFPEEQKTPENMGLVGFDPTNTKGFIPPKDVLKDEPGGMLDYMKTSKEAQYGRDLNALEATAANLPFVGSVMDSNEARAESVEKRLYSGDFRDSLEASKLALSIGIPQDEVRRVNADANGDQDAMRKGFSDLVSNQLAQRIVTRQKKGDRLNEFDLNVLENAGVGAAGLVKTVAEMSSPTAAAVTIGPSMMNRAAGMADGEWTVGPDGKPVEVMAGDDGDTAMLKGLGGAVAERAVWMNPWMSKWAGAVAKKAGGSMLANNAAQVVDMTLKNDLTDLADNVVGLDKSKIDESKEVEDWAKEHFLPQNLAKDIIHSAVAHVGMKGLRLATKSGREALANEIGAEIERRGALEERRMAQERAAEADAQELTDAKRSAQKAAYDASMSDEAKFALEQEIDAQVKAGSIPEAARDTVRENVMSKVENARSLEDADLREGALMIAVAEMQNPTRVTSPAHERRQTEAKMRENERWAKRSDELAKEYEAEQSKPAERAPNDAEAVAAERTAREEELNRVFSEQYDAWKAERDAAEKEGRDFTTPEPTRESVARQMEFDLGDTRTSKAENDAARAEKEGKAAHDAYEADQQKTADERELADFAKGEADAVAAKRARQADLDAAFADYDSYLAERDAKLKKGEPVKGETQTPEAISNAMRGDAVLQRIDSAYKRAKTSAERNALKEQFKARIEELRGKIGEEPAKTDAETQKLTDEVSKNDSETAKTDTDTDAAFRAWAVGRDGKPLEFATKEDEARSRETFDMLVKMGKVDPQTGKAIEPKYGEVKEPIATESTSASQTPPAASVMKNTAEAETMSDVELGGKIAKAAQDYEWSMSNGRDIRPYKNGMMDLVGKADAHDLGVLIKAAEIETARKFKWKKNYEGKKVEPDHIRAWRELKEEAQRRLNEIEEASGNAPATPPAASAAKEVQPPAPTAAKSAEVSSRASGEASAVTTAVTSAQKLLKEKFYADEKTLAKQLAALPAQAPKELRSAYETAIAEARLRAENQSKSSAQLQKNPDNHTEKMNDPAYIDEMHKKGRPVNWATRQDYDRKNAETAVGNLRRLVPNLKVVWEKSENAQPTPSAQLIRAKSGENLGWFDPSDASVHYLPGADVTTAAHETLGHVAKAYFEQTNPALAQKMLEYGRTAPDSIKIAVDSIYGAGAATDEYMAWRIQQDGALKLLQKAKTDADRKWIGKIVASANEMRKDIAMKLGGNRINAEKMMSMTPAQMMDYLSTKAVEGKTLGNIERRETVRMSKSDGWSDTKKDVWERNLHDYRNDIKTLQADAEKALGRKLTEAEDAYSDFRLMPGKLQNIKDSVDSKLAEYQKILKDSGISHEDMVKFMQADATMERVENLTNELGIEEMTRRGEDFGTGMSKMKAAEIIQSMQDIGKLNEAQRIQDFLLQMQAEGLQQRVNDGILDYDTAAGWVAKEQKHVPFKSGVDADGNFVRWDAKQGLIGSNEFKKAKGRETLAGDSISWMFDEYAHAFSRGAENQARQKVLRLVQALNANGSKVAEITPMNASSAREMTKRPWEGGTGDSNVFEVKVDGKSYSVRLDGERGELLTAAINGRNLRNMPHGWQKFMRVYSNFATAWSPTFGLRNFLGDSIDIAGNYTGEYGYIKGKKAQAIHAAEVAKITPALIKYVATGKAEGKFADILHAYEAAGGKISGFKNQGYADISNILRTEIKRGMSAKDAILKYTGLEMAGRGMEAYNSYFELVNRLASFETSRRMGKSDKDAALWSRESTVDFNMKGNLTGISNGLYMFSNSALGASARQLKSLLGSRKGASLAASLFAYGFAEGALEAWVNGDEEGAIKSGDTTGKDISEYTRANSIYFRKGNTVYRVPFHAGPFALIKYLGNLSARYAAGKVSEKNASAIKGGDVAKKLTKEAASDATQLMGLGNVNFDTKDGTLSSTAIAALVTAVPTISQQVLQPIMNVDYAGRTHHKETMDKEKPSSYNGRKQTSQTAKDVAMAINDATASEGERKGIVDFSPETYQSMFKGVFKNVASDVDKAASVGRMIMGTEDVDVRKIPFASDYVRTSDSGNTDRYYAAKKDFDANVDYLKKHEFANREERSKYIEKFPWVADKRVQRIIDRVDYYRKLEDGQYRNKSGKWVPREWNKEQTNSFEQKRKELQAMLLKIMKRD